MYFLISSGFTYCRKNLQDIAVDASYMTLYIQKLQFSYKMSFFEPIFAIRYYDQKNTNFLVITSICQIERKVCPAKAEHIAIFYTLITSGLQAVILHYLFRRELEHRGILKILAELAESHREVRSGGYALVHNESDRQAALRDQLALLHHGDVAEVTHSERKRYRAELIYMMVPFMWMEADWRQNRQRWMN